MSYGLHCETNGRPVANHRPSCCYPQEPQQCFSQQRESHRIRMAVLLPQQSASVGPGPHRAGLRGARAADPGTATPRRGARPPRASRRAPPGVQRKPLASPDHAHPGKLRRPFQRKIHCLSPVRRRRSPTTPSSRDSTLGACTRVPGEAATAVFTETDGGSWCVVYAEPQARGERHGRAGWSWSP